MRRLARGLPAAFATVLLGVAIGAVAMTASGGLKLPLDPWRGLSDDARDAEVQAVYQQHADFIREFGASGRDPRALHKEQSQSYSAGPDTLAEALATSDVVVLATVRGVTFEPIPGQWLGQARVTIDVIQRLKGDVGATLTIIEPGSPAPTTDGDGVLQEVDVTPVLLPGDRALLALVGAEANAFTPVAGAGIVYLEGNLARPLDRAPLRPLLADRTEQDILGLYLRTLSQGE